MIARLRTIWNDYPRQFWTLFFGTLVNSAGSGLFWPFLSLYLTRYLGFSMTQVGVVLSAFAAASAVGQVAGGSLADRLGRKPVILFSLFGGALGTLSLGLISLLPGSSGPLRLIVIAVVILASGLTGPAAGPALNAMVADLVEERKRPRAFSLMRVVQNLGVAIGPAVGGFVATRSYLVLFAVAALASVTYGLIIAFFTRETRPAGAPEAAASAGRRAPSFAAVLRDRVFVLFCGLVSLSLVVYSQISTTLPVYLSTSFAISEQWYGLLMSLNAAMVVLFQFPITAITSRYARASMMALGMLFFTVGFGTFGFVTLLPLFFLGQAIWTTGEMIAFPVWQAFVADIAPEAMRGRYMGVFGLNWTVGFGLGPFLGGIVMDALGGRYIWHAAVVVDLLVLAGFLALGSSISRRAGRLRGVSKVA